MSSAKQGKSLLDAFSKEWESCQVRFKDIENLMNIQRENFPNRCQQITDKVKLRQKENDPDIERFLHLSNRMIECMDHQHGGLLEDLKANRMDSLDIFCSTVCHNEGESLLDKAESIAEICGKFEPSETRLVWLNSSCVQFEQQLPFFEQALQTPVPKIHVGECGIFSLNRLKMQILERGHKQDALCNCLNNLSLNFQDDLSKQIQLLQKQISKITIEKDAPELCDFLETLSDFWAFCHEFSKKRDILSQCIDLHKNQKKEFAILLNELESTYAQRTELKKWVDSNEFLTSPQVFLNASESFSKQGGVICAPTNLDEAPLFTLVLQYRSAIEALSKMKKPFNSTALEDSWIGQNNERAMVLSGGSFAAHCNNYQEKISANETLIEKIHQERFAQKKFCMEMHTHIIKVARTGQDLTEVLQQNFKACLSADIFPLRDLKMLFFCGQKFLEFSQMFHKEKSDFLHLEEKMNKQDQCAEQQMEILQKEIQNLRDAQLRSQLNQVKNNVSQIAGETQKALHEHQLKSGKVWRKVERQVNQYLDGRVVLDKFNQLILEVMDFDTQEKLIECGELCNNKHCSQEALYLMQNIIDLAGSSANFTNSQDCLYELNKIKTSLQNL